MNDVTLKTLVAHGHFVAALAWSADGSQFVSASNDQTIKFWDAGTWKNRLTISAAHRGVVSGVSWSADGRRLASAGEDGLIKTWEPATGRAIGSLRGHAGTVHAVCWRRAVTADTVGVDPFQNGGVPCLRRSATLRKSPQPALRAGNSSAGSGAAP